MVATAGDHSALESQIRQLGKALDDSRFQIQQTENIIRSKTPTGPELDTSYKGYVSILAILILTCTKPQFYVKEQFVCSIRAYVVSEYHAALELMNLDVQSQALLLSYHLSRTCLFLGPQNCCNDKPVPLH